MSVNIFINGQNAKDTWGVLTTSNTLSNLLAPAPMKDYITNTSRLENGTRYDAENVKVAARDVNLEIQMIADSPEQFYARHSAFCKELQKGNLNMYIDDRPDVIYRFVYRSCSQYTQFCRGIATLSLKLTEPNPMNRE